MYIRRPMSWLLVLLVGLAAQRVGALGTAITYQGQVLQSGAPVSGSCDVQFSLYDAVSAGTQVGSTLTQTGVTVSNGAFTVQLDFGATVFAGGADRWLQLAARCPAGSGSFTSLSPRQMLTPAPYALFSQNIPDGAVTSSKLDNRAVGTTQLQNGAVTSAKISDGTITPTDVGFNYADSSSKGGAASDVACTGCVAPSELSATGSSSGQVLMSTGAGVSWGPDSLTLPATLSASSSGNALTLRNTGPGTGAGAIYARTTNGQYAVYGQANSNGSRGVGGFATAGAGVFGQGAVGVQGVGVGVNGVGMTARGDGTGVYADGGLVGLQGNSANGNGMYASSGNVALRAVNGHGNAASLATADFAGDFAGNVTATGSLHARSLSAYPGGIYSFPGSGSDANAARLMTSTPSTTAEIKNLGGGYALDVESIRYYGQQAGVGINIVSVGDSIRANGRVVASAFHGSCTIPYCNSDLAETLRSAEATEPGDLVILVDTQQTNPTVRRAARAYDCHLIGVVSTDPGLVFDQGKTRLAGDNSNLTTPDKAVVAAVGRVPTKVSMENGPIAVGDAITSSNTPGVGMKATKVGKIVGYALESAAADGKILVWIEPGHYLPPEIEERLNDLLAAGK